MWVVRKTKSKSQMKRYANVTLKFITLNWKKCFIFLSPCSGIRKRMLWGIYEVHLGAVGGDFTRWERALSGVKYNTWKSSWNIHNATCECFIDSIPERQQDCLKWFSIISASLGSTFMLRISQLSVCLALYFRKWSVACAEIFHSLLQAVFHEMNSRFS